MVWEQRVPQIVMLEACVPYFPNQGPGSSVSFGPFSVRLESVTRKSSYVVRMFELLCQLSIGERRHLSHFTFSGWHDGAAVPDRTAPLMAMQEEARGLARGAGPVVVHDNVGGPRAGLYIAIENAEAQIKTGHVNFESVVSKLRSDRAGMVQ